MKLAPLFKHLTYLRRWWLIFSFIVLMGEVMSVIEYYSHYDTFAQFMQVHFKYLRRTYLHVLTYALLLAISYTGKRAFWWLAVGISTYKLIMLMHFYFTVDWRILSTDYNSELMHVFYKLRLYPIAGLLFGNNPVAVAFLSGVYLYWIIGCVRMIQQLTRGAFNATNSQEHILFQEEG
ncbi:hypothetical protein [Hymenobacter luteus]|uniref:hypothetical protein n=1 Tax=Hymenobacter luteus TaxID=1411122 RepID=UPI001C85DE12|nr:hypothetical protein [Hymenobacter luteus]